MTRTRFVRTPFLANVLSALLLGLLLSACDRQDANMYHQSGVWDITRITTTTYDSVGTVTKVETATDVGQVAFIATDGRPGDDNGPGSVYPEVRFYLDKAAPIGLGLTYLLQYQPLEWYVDQHERHRVSFGANSFSVSGTPTIVYTLRRDTPDEQEWENLVAYPNNVIRRREVWQLRRVE